jgi:ABC-type uncharacterized transport system ATPase subunit
MRERDIPLSSKEVLLLKKGRLIMKGEPAYLLQSMDGKVFEVRISDTDELDQLQSRYRVSHISNDSRGQWKLMKEIVLRHRR